MKNRFLVIRSLAWLLLLGLVVLSLVPIPAPPTDLPNSDKWLHLLSYLVLTYAFLHAYPLRPGRVLIGFLGLGLGKRPNLDPSSLFRRPRFTDECDWGAAGQWLVFGVAPACKKMDVSVKSIHARPENWLK